MKIKLRLLFLLITSVSCFVSCQKQDSVKEQKPNIIYILADDLGYGELGVYGQKNIIPAHRFVPLHVIC